MDILKKKKCSPCWLEFSSTNSIICLNLLDVLIADFIRLGSLIISEWPIFILGFVHVLDKPKKIKSRV